MSAAKPTLRIVWGFNPFQDSRAIRNHLTAFMSQLVKKNPLEIKPVYVSSPYELSVALEFSEPAATRFKEVALKQAQHFLAEVTAPRLAAPHILIEDDPSLTLIARNLAEYAQKQRSDFVLLGTHGRSGLSRLLLGSFAETFLFHSQTPVVLFKPKTKVPSGISRILFTTDFSSASKKAFAKLCRFASRLGASVVLYHAIQKPPKPHFSLGDQLFGKTGFVLNFLDLETRRREREAQPMINQAKKLGVAASAVIETSPKPIDQAIQAQAKAQQADLIALASQSGQLKAGLFGSVARKVVRQSSLPLWIAHPLA